MRALAFRSEFNSDHRLVALGARYSGEPDDFHQAVTLEPEESPVVRMALPLVTSLEKENGIDLSFHQDRSWGGKPAVELFCPGTKRHIRRQLACALHNEAKRP